MELPDAIKQFRAILTQKLLKRQERKEFVEIVMVLVVGMLWGLYNPHQVAQQLGTSPQQLYAALKRMSAAQWRTLLEKMMIERATERLREYTKASAAKKSRLAATLSIDDSVVKRMGEVLSYVWAWYSGQAKQVVSGQDLIGIVVRIDAEIIPLSLVWVSKQGRGATTKPAVLLQEVERLKTYFAEEGIDLTSLGVSLDSWWLGHDTSSKLAEMGFTKQVIAAKKSQVIATGQESHNLGEWKTEVEYKEGWAQPRAASRLSGDNPTLGKVIVVMFHHPRSKTFAVICPARALRKCEALRIWANHHAVETFWKRMKSWLGLGRMQLRGRAGAWAELTLRVLAYFFGATLLGSHAGTLAQLTAWLRRQATFADLIDEHFQLD